MCESNKRFFFYLLRALLFASVAGVLRAEEPGPWFLISETELRIIEEYRTKSETEKQTWLLQVQGLNVQVRNLNTHAESLRQESKILNSQLAVQREQTRILQQSFNEYEAGQLTLISLKNGEIAGLKQEAADKALETAAYKRSARNRLVVIIALAGAWIVLLIFKVCRFVRRL